MSVVAKICNPTTKGCTHCRRRWVHADGCAFFEERMVAARMAARTVLPLERTIPPEELDPHEDVSGAPELEDFGS